jgi:glycosyltransferase involved in cell wall biosynthesis
LYGGKSPGILPVVVVGDTRRSALYQETVSLIEEARLGHLFRFLGMVPDADMPALYASARALIYPSLYEGFGLPPLEAMACGTPVVASNAASLPEVVGKAALMVDPNDPESLLQALDVLCDETVRGKLRQEGQIQAQRFSWATTASEIADVITNEGEVVTSR